MSETNSQQPNVAPWKKALWVVSHIVVIVGIALAGPLITAVAAYCSGWGYDTDWVESVDFVYFFFVEPCLIFPVLSKVLRPRDSAKVPIALAAIALGAILTSFGRDRVNDAFGFPVDIQLQGIVHQIHYRHLEPTLMHWVTKMVHDTPRASRIPATQKYETPAVPIAQSKVPYDVRRCFRKECSYWLTLDPKGKPMGVLIKPESGIFVAVDPSLIHRESSPYEVVRRKPYPGISVGYYAARE
ncbi:MAG TPA: hypothetical protein VGK19_12810 [Capsulimonadaceae bacterium]|jgi:hypothetical protein